MRRPSPSSSGPTLPSGAAPSRSPPARAGFWIRTLAASIDATIAFGVALALSSTVGMWFAERAVVTLRIGEPGTLWRGPIPFVLGAVGEVVYGLPFAALLVGGLDPLTGRTPGKRLVGLRVRRADGAPAELPRRASRWAIQAVGFWGWTLALIAGRWEIAALATAAVAIVIAGMLAALGPHSRALHDRASGTVVVRSR